MADKEGKAISRQVLYDEIWTDSARKVAERYEVTYSRFLKICKENNIPIPPSGYWTKLGFNKPVKRTPLPGSKIEMIQLIPEKEKQIDTDMVIAAESIPVLEEDKISLEIKREKGSSKYNRETLYQEVWENPVTEVAKRYKMSDVNLRKICKKLDVPLPPLGYWAKIRAGKKVSKPSLPKLKTPPNENKPKNGKPRSLHVDETVLSFLKEEDRLKVIEAASKLRVAGPSARLYKDIEAQKEKCADWLKQQKNGSFRYGRYAEDKPLLADSMSPETYSRAFHILDALIKGMLPFGASVTYYFHFQVNGEDVPFSMSEAKNQIPHEITYEEKTQLLQYEEAKRKHSWAPKPNIPKWDRPWNGRLSLIVNGKYKFMDCKSYVLEDRIGEIMIAFYEASYAIRLVRLEKEKKERIEEEKRRKAAEIRERYNQEVDYLVGLVNAANDYATACKIRAYVEAVKSSGCKSADWIEWANAKADWYDPTIGIEDPYFGIRRHYQNPDQKTPKKKYYDW